MIYNFYPLSENALTVYFEQKIDPQINDLVVATAEWILENPFLGFREVVPAFSSLTVFYDLVAVKNQTKGGQLASDWVKAYLEQIPFEMLKKKEVEKNIIEIPVHYNGPDLAKVSKYTGLSKKEIVSLHTSREYRVYMMGFLPGFAYLGGMDERLKTPRREKPRLRVPAGSVGIAGNQTGIYPVTSPGGWQIIGETELILFDPKSENMCLLSIGCSVKFKSV